MTILVTGNAGFIGYHLVWKLIEQGETVIGYDCVNDYYDPQLKEIRLARLANFANQTGVNYTMVREDLADQRALQACFDKHMCNRVIHLAAQAGVRHSLSHPEDYVQSNLVGFANLLEQCRQKNIDHLTYASTSSVYGTYTNMPFQETTPATHPIQLYAATKRANELMAHSYSHLYNLPCTALRFFTVYGPWGRPDMALFRFTKNILAGEAIDVFNHGNHTRDFTYIDDIVDGIIRVHNTPATANRNWQSDNPDPATSFAPWRVYNIGNNRPIKLLDYIAAIENATGKKAKINMCALQPGDAPDTCADIQKIQTLGYQPATSVNQGVENFVAWYRDYYAL